MIRIPTFSTILFIGFAVSAQSIKLRGTVTNQKGNPIPNAVVTLVGQKLSDTTDSKGVYSITSNTSSINLNSNPAKSPFNKISVQKGVVRIGLSKFSEIKIELYNIKGKLIGNVINNPSPTGNCVFNLKKHLSTSNITIIRVIVGGNSTIFRYTPLHKSTRIKQSSTNTSITAFAFEQKASVLDTLHVTANNYKTKEEAVFAYEGLKNIKLDSSNLSHFSFFVTSLKALQELSGSKDGFGGDLRYGETGPGAGLRGADKICECIAERSMPGSKVKQWRAFLSVSADENGKRVDARDRIGNGPWYDRLGRLLAPTLADLINKRPMNGDQTIKDDLPNEDGIPNHRPDPNKPAVDNHHMLTGSDKNGRLYSAQSTCNDWTSTDRSARNPMAGLSWPRFNFPFAPGMDIDWGVHWITGHVCPGCLPGVDIHGSGGPKMGDVTVGAGGGYGGFYCFALNP